MPKILLNDRLFVPENARLTLPLPNSKAIFDYEDLLTGKDGLIATLKKWAVAEGISEDERVARQYLAIRNFNSRIAGAVVVANPVGHHRLGKVVNLS